MKIILEYNNETGQLIDKNGIYVGIYVGIVPFDDSTTVDTIIKLKEAGFSANDIIEMNARGVVQL